MGNELLNNDFNNDNKENSSQYNSEENRYYDMEIVDITKNKEEKKKKPMPMFLKATSTALVFGLVAGMTFQGFNYATGYINNKSAKESSVKNETNETQEVISSVSADSDDGLLQTGNSASAADVSEVVENVMPSIVSINSTVTQNVQDVFGRIYSQDATGSGSGIIIGQNSEQVLIVTNNHVIDGATEVQIVFADKSVATAEIKGTDSTSDLAVVAVELKDLKSSTKETIKVATIGDSTQTKVGEMAIAIGNALGYGQSVTVGYISALGRQVSVEDDSMKLIQTDAAINPGNSGGALLNAKGEVIGINSVKYASEEVEGMGYAIPISDAVPIINELMNYEEIPEAEQAYLGIMGRDVTSVYSESFGMPEGVFISDVTSNSPAQKAGLEKGSIITKYNDKKVSSMEDLQKYLSNTKSGATAVFTVKIAENGEYVEKEVSVKLGSKAEMAENSGEQTEEGNFGYEFRGNN